MYFLSITEKMENQFGVVLVWNIWFCGLLSFCLRISEVLINLLIKSSWASVTDLSADITCGTERFESIFFFGVNCKKTYEGFLAQGNFWTYQKHGPRYFNPLTKERSVSLWLFQSWDAMQESIQFHGLCYMLQSCSDFILGLILSYLLGK